MKNMIDYMISQIDKVHSEITKLEKKFLKMDLCPFCAYPEYMAVKIIEEHRKNLVCLCFSCKRGWIIRIYNDGEAEIEECDEAAALIKYWPKMVI